jgi:hypothetical protein
VQPLLRLLREGTPEGQEEAAKALGWLAADKRRVSGMRQEGSIIVFLQILVRGSMKVQVSPFSVLQSSFTMYYEFCYH